MPTPSKSVLMIQAEGRSHRTKAEIEARRKAEEELRTHTAMREWPEVKKCPEAHKEFARLNRLFKKIRENDALNESVINRYCLLKFECSDYAEKKERFFADMIKLDEAYEDDKIPPSDYFKTLASMQAQVNACDKQLMAKRKMMLDIEKESLMTIAAALRSVPKQPKKEEQEDPMSALLQRRKA